MSLRAFKISVVISSYSETGVPLAQLRFIRALAARNHDVELIIGNLPDHLSAPEVPASVALSIWQCSRATHMIPRLIRHLRTRQPDIVFTSEDNLNASVLLAAILCCSRAKISCSSRISPRFVYDGKAFTFPWFFRKYVGSVLWRADALTCVSKDMVQEYENIFPRHRFVGVYNVLDRDYALPMMKEEVSHPWISDRSAPLCITAGHLAPRKGFVDLLVAISFVAERRAVRLIVLGDGPQLPELEAVATSLGIADFVDFVGHVENTLKYFARADVFVLSSYLEGMPNVLVEAMIAGCSPVATDCPTGPREILQGGGAGYLVPMHDPASLADAIEKAIDDPIPKERLVEATKPFSARAVLNQHFALLGLTLNNFDESASAH